MKRKEKNIEWVIKNYSSFFENFKMDEANVITVYNDWKLMNPNKRINDFIWAMFNELLLRIAKQAKTETELYKYQRIVYGEMVYFLKRIESRNANYIVKLFQNCVLNEAALSPLFLKAEVLTDSRCEVCKNFKYIAPIEQALKDSVIPLNNCPNPLGCTCCYAFQSERDKNGRLIRNNRI